MRIFKSCGVVFDSVTSSIHGDVQADEKRTEQFLKTSADIGFSTALANLSMREA